MRKTVRIDGLKELDRVLKNDLPKATARRVMQKALIEAAEPMAAKARALAPDDPNTIDLDYDLRESIGVGTKAEGADAGKAAFAKTMRAGGSRSDAASALVAARRADKATRSAVVAYVGPSKIAFHGTFQEFGTRHHAPQPFMRPAFAMEAKPTIERLKVTLSDQINQAVARAAARAARGK
ncbi:HK97-gp10 family putative phage morphogenesis protein [Pseudooceanicola sp. C21-150M6]|uniref:HK97-gp10 family putative phage morphogenesis protein n=1 Tax=Pseudooceanicola sp. C21-150M6 TaxID=3434355 RepID=UPI003D7FC08F